MRSRAPDLLMDALVRFIVARPDLRHRRPVRIVAGQERFQRRLRGLVRRCGGQIEHRTGIGFRVVSPGVE